MKFRKGLLCVVLGAASQFAFAVDVASHAEAVLNDVEIKAEMAVLAPQLKAAVKGSEGSAENLAADLIARRAIAARARSEGLDNDPVVAARVKLAGERALYEAYMEQAATKAVDPELVERLARDEYRAFPEKFRRAEEVRVRHVLIRSCACAPERAREQAEAILARLQAGESFEAVAEKESADLGSAKLGGDVGFFPRGKMVGPFENAAFSLTKPGELSGLVETQFGYHILRFEERKPAAAQSFEEVREALVESIGTKLKAATRLQIVGPIREPRAITIDTEALREAVGMDPDAGKPAQ